jgi:hypothetical protein
VKHFGDTQPARVGMADRPTPTPSEGNPFHRHLYTMRRDPGDGASFEADGSLFSEETS